MSYNKQLRAASIVCPHQYQDPSISCIILYIRFGFIHDNTFIGFRLVNQISDLIRNSLNSVGAQRLEEYFASSEITNADSALRTIKWANQTNLLTVELI